MVHKLYKRMLEGMRKKQKKSRRKSEPWSVYILRCGDESLYTGVAKDIDERFKKHSSGKGAKYTRTRLPLAVVYRETCRSRTDALVRECEVKALNRTKKIGLIEACEGKVVVNSPRRRRKKAKKKSAVKKRTQKALVLLLLWLVPSYAFARVEYPWQPRRDQDGIRVQVRKVPNSESLEFKAVMLVDADIRRVAALYEDASKVTEWYYHSLESSEVKKLGPDEKIHYFAMDMPWPVKDRDSVYKRTKSIHPETGALEYRLSEAPGYVEPQRGRVRVPNLRGLWRFTPKGEGKTEIFYQQHGEAGGHIPAFLVNRLAEDIPFESLSGFRSLLNEDANAD